MVSLLEFETGQTYRLHISSMDWQHGFSLQPVNIDAQILLGYEMVLTGTADISREQTIICNEFYDIGRHTMLGKIHATEGAMSADLFRTCPESGLQFHKYEGSIPLVTFGALTACIIAVFTIASGAIILIPTYLWSIGYINHIDPAMYRLVWWAPGNLSQPIDVAAHVAVWYAVAAIVFGARPLSEKVSRTAFFLYIAFLQLARAHHCGWRFSFYSFSLSITASAGSISLPFGRYPGKQVPHPPGPLGGGHCPPLIFCVAKV